MWIKVPISSCCAVRWNIWHVVSVHPCVKSHASQTDFNTKRRSLLNPRRRNDQPIQKYLEKPSECTVYWMMFYVEWLTVWPHITTSEKREKERKGDFFSILNVINPRYAILIEVSCRRRFSVHIPEAFVSLWVIRLQIFRDRMDISPQCCCSCALLWPRITPCFSSFVSWSTSLCCIILYRNS